MLQRTVVPNSLPTTNVTPAAATTNTSWRSAPRSHRPPVSSPSRPPITSAATAATPSEAAIAALPAAKNQGASGATAPRENATSEEMADRHGEPSSSGFTPRTLRAYTRSARSGSRNSPSVARAQAASSNPARCIAFCRIARSRSGSAAIAARSSEQPLEELDLRAHRDPLADRHRARAGDEARETRELNDVRRAGRPGHAEDE